jgi:hypothetical protein
VVESNRDGFDYLPVIELSTDARERIVGLIELVPFLHGEAAHGVVRDHMRPLSEDNLIGADAGILAFVKGADRHRCRLVVSGSEITGLVSLSDLQKLPVRAALFAVITHAEMTMADAIRREFNGTEGWKQRLSSDRQGTIQDEYDKVAADDNLVEHLLFTQFADKIAIIRKSPDFALGKNAFEAAMKAAQKLRDKLMHANDYASTRPAAIKVCETVRSIEQWIDLLSSWPAAPASMSGEH